MNICFIANFNKTYFFYDIAQVLSEKYNYTIFWIVVNKQNKKFLEERGEKILYLPQTDVIRKGKGSIGEFKLNELVFNDRILKFNRSKGIQYLTGIQKPIYNFLQINNIQYIFGELTWAHELLIFRMLNDRSELRCKYLNPHTIRIPGGRFAFFEDEFQSKLYTLHSKTEDRYSEEYFIPKKPDYLALNDKILKRSNSMKGRLKRLKRLITSENLDKEDITLPERWSFNRLFTPLLNEVRKETYKLFPKVDLNFVKDKNFIFLTLHKQPEASVDVLGRYMEDQTLNIKNIWKQLPDNWWLVVKEHTNAIGDRPLKFYKELLKYNKIVFIDEKTDSYKLLDYCQVVVTISGTVAYEAALLKKKTLVLCDVFFDFSYVKKITLEDLKNSKNILDILDTIPNRVDDDKKKKLIYSNSFEGIISDPISNPKCLESNNINNIVTSIVKITHEYSR